MRVLLADKLSPRVSTELEAAGCAVTADPGLSGDALQAALAQVQPEVLVVRSTAVTEAHLSASRSLSLVIRAGAGVNTIDVEAASGRGIYVANCPGKNAIAVAELTLGHLINLDRRIADNVADLRAGRWAKKTYSKADGLYGKRMAVLGCGSIGVEVIRRAQAFGLKVRAWSRSLTPDAAAALGVEFAPSPLAACRGADVLSIHLALSPETRGLVGRELLEALNRGAYVVNTSRGEVVDQPALVEAIDTRGLRAGLDVFADEPASGDGPFADPIGAHPSVYGTHHIGASTQQAVEQVGQAVIDIVTRYQLKGTVADCVNLATETVATHLLVVRHADRVGVLASVLGGLRRDGVNVQEMENIIFRGARAACARLHIDRAPSGETLAEIESSDSIFALSLVALEA